MESVPRVSRRSIAIAAFSTIVEWYDFTLYLYFATVLSRVFFATSENALTAALGGFAVAYLMRPVGAVVFGWLGDRRGRRPMMLWSMALMALAMALTAMLPTSAQIGGTAAILLLLLRCLMGFSVGGEYTGVVAYLIESAPRNRRGLVTSLAAAASEIGALLAVGVSALTVSLTSPEALESWGWRIPFAIGAALAAGVLLARATMQESPEFERLRERQHLPANPLQQVWQTQRAGVYRGFAISALGSITYYVGITYVPSFLTSTAAMSETLALWLSTVAAAAVILITPLVGLASDRFGRKPVLIIFAGLSAALPALLFAQMAGAETATVLGAAIVLACVAGGVSAVGAVATAEQFGGAGRVTGLALGATIATAIFGGMTPWLAGILIERTGRNDMPGLMIAAVALCVLPVFLTMRETRPLAGNGAGD